LIIFISSILEELIKFVQIIFENLGNVSFYSIFVHVHVVFV
jgi:hypothetical protein